MKKNLILGLSLLVGTMVSAQTVNVDVTQNECTFVKDSLIIEMTLTGEVNGLDSKDAIVLTPFLSAPNEDVDLTSIQLNGKYKQILYTRNKEIRSRMKNAGAGVDDYTQGLSSNGKFSVNYRASLAKADWMNDVALQIRCMNLNADNESEELSNFFVQRIEYIPTVNHITASSHRGGATAQSLDSYRTHAPAESKPVKGSYRGSYLSPESDAMDERNQRDLNFSLEEAQVMMNVNPQILSLKELFTVAMSYKEDREKFYSIISTSVKLFPTHPIANLNAASMAIELGDVEAASKYLQIAPYESLAYKNCRGAYELMIGNIYEGMRLLKSAKSEGSEEAGYNLDVFFKQNK